MSKPRNGCDKNCEANCKASLKKCLGRKTETPKSITIRDYLGIFAIYYYAFTTAISFLHSLGLWCWLWYYCGYQCRPPYYQLMRNSMKHSQACRMQQMTKITALIQRKLSFLSLASWQDLMHEISVHYSSPLEDKQKYCSKFLIAFISNWILIKHMLLRKINAHMNKK